MENKKSESRRKLWKNRELNGLCIYCGNQTPVSNKKGCQICLDKKVKNTLNFDKKHKGEKQLQYRLRIKYEILKMYGNKCKCCGEEEKMFLTIDHINNDGKKDRDEKYNTHKFYLSLKRNPLRNDLQVLCFNCNLGKSINGGICPHKFINKTLLPIIDNRRKSNFNVGNKINWVNDEELIIMCNSTSVADVARKLGVSFSTISGRLKRRNKYHLVVKNRKCEN